MRVGGVEASRTATGRYEIKGLRPGAAAIKVTGPSHESTETSVTLKPGENEVEVGVSLTPAETYSRYFQAYKSRPVVRRLRLSASRRRETRVPGRLHEAT